MRALLLMTARGREKDASECEGERASGKPKPGCLCICMSWRKTHRIIALESQDNYELCRELNETTLVK